MKLTRSVSVLVSSCVLLLASACSDGPPPSRRDADAVMAREQAYVAGVEERADLYADGRLRGETWPMFLGRSVALMTVSSNVLVNGDRATVQTYVNQYCPNEKFSGEPTAKIVDVVCSSFLVSRRTVATAAHCLLDPRSVPVPLSDLRIVFGYLKRPGSAGPSGVQTSVSTSDVYKVARVAARGVQALGVPGDWAILELDRDVSPNRPALRLGDNAPVNANAATYYMIGYPDGLSTKISYGGAVVTQDGGAMIVSGLDTMGGNSGSPVLNAQNQVVGLISSGVELDYKLDPVASCMRPVVGDFNTFVTSVGSFKSAVGSQPTSCAGVCGTFTADNQSCHCHPSCLQGGHCCSDFLSLCWNSNLLKTNACAGHCGGYNQDRGCFCDQLCPYYGDCCDGYFDACGSSKP